MRIFRKLSKFVASLRSGQAPHPQSSCGLEQYRAFELDNAGERLIPGISHNKGEFIRHRSSYNLYYHIIVQDMLKCPDMLSRGIKICDLGCGCGHGSHFISQIPNSTIFAVDVSEKALGFAKDFYRAPNINYVLSSIEDFASCGGGESLTMSFLAVF